jgi:hypothetical protein
MSRRTARGNRIGLAVLGLILLAGGAIVLARGLAARPSLLGPADRALTTATLRAYADAHGWFWPVIAAAGIILALLALRWLAVQGRTDATGDLRLERDPSAGISTLPASVLTDAVEDDLQSSPYVQQANATLSGAASAPRLTLSVTLLASADPAAAADRIAASLARLRQALDTGELAATVRIRTVNRT